MAVVPEQGIDIRWSGSTPNRDELVLIVTAVFASNDAGLRQFQELEGLVTNPCPLWPSQPSDRLFGRAPGLGWAIDMGVILRLAKIRANCCGVMGTRWTPRR